MIPDDCDIVFVGDMFSADHLGGAELTTDAIIDASSYNVFRLHSKDVSEDLLSQGLQKHWVFGNYSGMDWNLIPTIVANMTYSIVEFDYKFCKYRSTEKHMQAETKPCDCHNQMHGKIVSAFYYGARSLWWMSAQQMQKFHTVFPFLSEVRNEVLSSVFAPEFFDIIDELRDKAKDVDRTKHIVVGSTSWIKGTQDSEAFCQEKELEYETIWSLPYPELLAKLSTAKGLVFLPKGGDTCPRLVIEAKLLGCDIVTNDNVQHIQEVWFNTRDISVVENYLRSAPDRFWGGIKEIIDYVPTISGYTTTLDCIEQDYPFEQSIGSMLSFCDQVVVVDGGSKDGTWERLQELSEKHEKLLVEQYARDWDHPRFAVFDGLQKAYARVLCTGEFCWQQDSDEVVHENDYERVKNLSKILPKNVDLLALPVIEYWGGTNKIRMDINPWKWRFSRNKPHITHGVPKELRKFDKNGDMYSLPGTDGCDYVRSDTFERVEFANFYTPEIESLRASVMQGNTDKQEYQQWFQGVTDNLPGVHHYSWYNIKRKIRTYRGYWSKHWQSLYDIQQEDTSENNMFFNKPWSDVTEDEIDSLADRLASEMGGWIFHTKIDFNQTTPHIILTQGQPKIAKEWTDK
jgi:glycosyltransferase involved in cell wall biosynthesis